jgi:REP element-mobilizing transposase RayT
MWNDRDTPLAYLITFRTYGTWLHGDERGSTDRHNNIYRTPHIAADDRWKVHNEQRLKDEPLILNAEMRSIVEQAIRETCAIRDWHLSAINVRTNHAHTVVAANRKAELVLNAFKANATRMLKQAGLWTSDHSPWADKGSCRRIWNEQGVVNAINYVVNGQGGDLPRFD